jgi:dTDP-4-dehydrorhamnose 3,5-epimerase
MAFAVTPLKLPEVVLITRKPIKDARGYFQVTWERDEFAAQGFPEFVQDNQAFSAKRGTIRGMHFQAPPHAQAKLVRVLSGAIFDVAVDLRDGAPTYGQWAGTTLTAHAGEAVFLPHGFAHGYCTLADDTLIAYRCDGRYAPETEGGLHFADPDLGIAWPVAAADAIVSDKDKTLPMLKDFVTPFDRDGKG